MKSRRIFLLWSKENVIAVKKTIKTQDRDVFWARLPRWWDFLNWAKLAFWATMGWVTVVRSAEDLPT